MWPPMFPAHRATDTADVPARPGRRDRRCSRRQLRRESPMLRRDDIVSDVSLSNIGGFGGEGGAGNIRRSRRQGGPGTSAVSLGTVAREHRGHI